MAPKPGASGHEGRIGTHESMWLTDLSSSLRPLPQAMWYECRRPGVGVPPQPAEGGGEATPALLGYSSATATPTPNSGIVSSRWSNRTFQQAGSMFRPLLCLGFSPGTEETRPIQAEALLLTTQPPPPRMVKPPNRFLHSQSWMYDTQI